MASFIGLRKAQGAQIGFVPTMGALHQGHISLIQAARKDSDIVVCSIFVNPTQFNDPSDLLKYPRTIEKDMAMLLQQGCDVLFYPDVSEMYTEQKAEKWDFGFLGSTLEAASRPGHYDGVATIVERLFKAVNPHRAYFGQKDYQQCMVVQSMIEQKQLPVELVICPTLREPNGLAMSSRNVRLSAAEREASALIYQVLQQISQQKFITPIAEVVEAAKNKLAQLPDSRIDYLVVVNARDLSPVNNWDDAPALVALAAVYVGEVRLIDNMLIS